MVLFEIPIYSMTKNEFDKRWEKIYNSSRLSQLSDYSVSNYFFPKNIWKFNQIIGYIVVLLKQREICFELWYCNDSKFYANSTQKHFMSNQSLLRCHFYVTANMDEAAIREEFNIFLDIAKESVQRGHFLDCSIYENVVKHISFKSIIDSNN